MVVGTTRNNEPVSVESLGVVGSLMTLLRQAILPNLVQTLEGQPALIHAGPFGNIAHGCNSILADRLGLEYADFVITEAGFGSDLGFEKFMHIKARQSGLLPNAAVLVASVRALKWHGGMPKRDLETPNPEAVRAGGSNLKHHIDAVGSFGVPVVVAINRFGSDSPEELQEVMAIASEAGAQATAECSGFANGGAGGTELAEVVVGAAIESPDVNYAYALDASVEEKVLALAQRIYGADDVSWAPEARRRVRYFEDQGWGNLPICMAKTHLSTSHDPSQRGSPRGYTFPISEIRVSLGAGFLYPLAGTIATLPGLPSRPRALDMDVDSSGEVIGL